MADYIPPGFGGIGGSGRTWTTAQCRVSDIPWTLARVPGIRPSWHRRFIRFRMADYILPGFGGLGGAGVAARVAYPCRRKSGHYVRGRLDHMHGETRKGSDLPPLTALVREGIDESYPQIRESGRASLVEKLARTSLQSLNDKVCDSSIAVPVWVPIRRQPSRWGGQRFGVLETEPVNVDQ